MVVLRCTAVPWTSISSRYKKYGVGGNSFEKKVSGRISAYGEIPSFHEVAHALVEGRLLHGNVFLGLLGHLARDLHFGVLCLAGLPEQIAHAQGTST